MELIGFIRADERPYYISSNGCEGGWFYNKKDVDEIIDKALRHSKHVFDALSDIDNYIQENFDVTACQDIYEEIFAKLQPLFAAKLLVDLLESRRIP